MRAGLTLGPSDPRPAHSPPRCPHASVPPADPSLSGRSWRSRPTAALGPSLRSLALAHPCSAVPPPHPAPRSHILRTPPPRAGPSPLPLPRSTLGVWISFPAALPGISAPAPRFGVQNQRPVPPPTRSAGLCRQPRVLFFNVCLPHSSVGPPPCVHLLGDGLSTSPSLSVAPPREF